MSIGILECLLVAIVFFIIFGPQKLPQLARDAGRIWQYFQLAYNQLRAQYYQDTATSQNKTIDASPKAKPPVRDQ